MGYVFPTRAVQSPQTEMQVHRLPNCATSGSLIEGRALIPPKNVNMNP